MAIAESSPRINEEAMLSPLAERFTDRQLRITGLLIAAGAVVATLAMVDSWPENTAVQGAQLHAEQFDPTPQPPVLGNPVAF